MLRFSTFSQRERGARKWTFVREWENEPTASLNDCRTQVSPRAEIITSPEAINLPGGKVTVRSPVPVLMSTRSSPRYSSPRKSPYRRGQFNNGSQDYPQVSPPYYHSKGDNSLEDNEELAAEEDSTQNNASSRSENLLESSNERGNLHDLTSDGLSREAGGLGRERLVNVKNYTHFQQSEQKDPEEQISEVLKQPVHDNLVKNHKSFSRGSMHSHESKRKKSPSPSKSIKGSAKKLKILNSAKKTRQNAEQETEIPNQSMVQLMAETPIQQSNRKLIKPRVIISESDEIDKKKKKKVRIRDKDSELVMQVWTGKDGDRLKRHVMDLDVIMHCITETLNKCKEDFTEKPQQRAISKFLSQINADIVSQIESKESVKEISSNLKKSRKNVQALRKELQSLQNKQDNLREKMEKAESESVVSDISSWMFGFQKFITKNKTRMMRLSTIEEEEDFVKIV